MMSGTFRSQILLLVIIIYTLEIDAACIPLDQCEAAIKHTTYRRDDLKSHEILRNAHCGIGPDRKPKFICENIPDFPTLREIFATPKQTTCIPLPDCPAAVKHTHYKRYDPKSHKILREAHCGFDDHNTAKVICANVPDFSIEDDKPNSTTEISSQTENPDCLPVQQCPGAHYLIETSPHDSKTIELLRSSACGSSARQDMVLCSKFASVITEDKDKWKLLPEDCGIQAEEEKIYKGTKAALDEFPWVALLKYKNTTGHSHYRCHGDLISRKYVVTAAHCIPAPGNHERDIVTVVLGEYNVTSSIDCVYILNSKDCALPVQEIAVKSFHVHPRFNSNGESSDIALIRLTENANFNDFVKTICLPPTSFILKVNERFDVAGWGKTDRSALYKTLMSDVKLVAKVSYLPDDTCNNFIGKSLDKGQICAGDDNGADTCRGDSGGPLMARRMQDGEQRIYLAGVVSWGGRCGQMPAVYTRVSYFTHWILNTIEE